MIKKMNIRGFQVEFYKGTNGKKYKAVVYKNNEKIKTVQFGAVDYEQYHDKLGLYKAKNHEDEERRRLYNQRHKRDRNFTGEITAGFLSSYILW